MRQFDEDTLLAQLDYLQEKSTAFSTLFMQSLADLESHLKFELERKVEGEDEIEEETP